MPVLNRAFLYGDGLFETMRAAHGQIPLWHWHYSRLSRSAALLHLDWPHLKHPQEILNLIRLTVGDLVHARVRLTLFRSGGGSYLPTSNIAHFLITATPATPIAFEEAGLKVGLFDKIPLPSGSPFWNIKSTNALPYIQASLYAQSRNWDDALLLNDHGRPTEGTSANIFCIQNEVLYTPPLSEGCIAGVLREWVLSKARHLGIKCLEVPLEPGMLQAANELWLVNAFRGIRWVREYQGKLYQGESAKEFMKMLKNSFL